ncbi:MAG: zinc-ribbon domain-containing protein, partial [bacterium]|nr:zinc-ribbon domain-containing protein [bacterium]
MYCPNCGKEYQENQNFCRFCGAKLNDNNSENDNLTNYEKFEENVSLQENTVKNT